MDCFAALAMTTKRTTSFPRRDAPGLCMNYSPKKIEGAGKTGCALHPRSRVQCARRNAHTSIQVQRRASGLPCAMALRLIARSPRRRIPLVTVACGLRLVQARLGRRISASLTSATDARTTRLRRTQQPVFANRLRRALAPFVCALTDRSRETRPATTSCAPTLPRPPHLNPRS
jgi:hypothetical protein